MSSQPRNESVPVIDIQNERVMETAGTFSQIRRLMLAGLGAAALAVDEANVVVEKLVVRGEKVEHRAKRETQALRDRLRQRRKTVLDTESIRAKMAQGTQVMAESVEELLHALNRPTQRDVERLQQEVDQLKQQVDILSATET